MSLSLLTLFVGTCTTLLRGHQQRGAEEMWADVEDDEEQYMKYNHHIKIIRKVPE